MEKENDMQFCVGTSELQQVIKLLGVTAKINSVDTAGKILIEADKSGVVNFFSNNGSTAISCVSTNVKVKSPGKTSIFYNKIRSFVTAFKPWNNECGAKEFCFHLRSDGLYITVDNVHVGGKITKGKLKIDHFLPELVQKPKPFGEVNFILNSSVFKAAVDKIIYAIEPNDFHRHALQGMSVQFEKDNIYFAGTNGRVLSEYQVKNVSDLTEGNFILKYDFIMGLKRLLMEETQLFFEINDKVINVKFNDIVFTGKPLIGYTYPEYKSALDDFKKSVVINKEVLISNVSPFVDILDSDDYYRLTFSIKNRQLMFESDQAKFVTEQDIDPNVDLIIDINGILMKETIDHIKDDKILLKFSDETGCLIFDSNTFENQKALITHIRRRG
jgi:DNA polymerase III sliding clamp (beta) subunit (PCNA family)